MYGIPYPRSEKELKALVADKRYWDDRHPEYDAYRAFVSETFRRTYPGEGSNGLSSPLGSGRFPSAKPPINARSLLDNFNRYNSLSSYSPDGADTTYKCRATGTCDIMP